MQKIKKHREKFQEKKYPNLGSLYATKNLYYDLSKISFTKDTLLLGATIVR